MTLLTRAEKEAIRNSPCGRCREKPPFADGSRCQPHRIIPGCDGGLYTRENTTPRCNKCHDIEHGGTGQAPFIGSARMAGKKGGKIGGRTLRDRHPDHFSRIGKVGGKIGGRRTHELHPDQARETGRRGGSTTCAKHPGHALRMVRIALSNSTPEELHERRSAAGKVGGRVTAETRRGKLSSWGKTAGARGGAHKKRDKFPDWGPRLGHIRWHEQRGLKKLGCRFCG